MYIPAFNRIEDPAILLEAMRAYSFAILFGPCADGEPTATHLPLVIRQEDTQFTIEGHFARANPHWQTLANQKTLVVFPGPHSYVSPTLYASQQSVPTWNYIAIHATGTLHLVEDEAGKEQLVRSLIAIHEPTHLDQWQSQTEHYRSAMLKNIVGFRIPIDKLEGKFKLSQNRPDPDRANIRTAQSTGSADEQALAAWMQRLGI
ncbi:MAG TPA: FMN-binding negative transcriptional regulator [Acidobacteriaceae bacterium]|jgi:transcriptional regulator|nr:FMN-binding negative transcriptional regulator [Acidobacteriaceae bacterium]